MKRYIFAVMFIIAVTDHANASCIETLGCSGTPETIANCVEYMQLSGNNIPHCIQNDKGAKKYILSCNKCADDYVPIIAMGNIYKDFCGNNGGGIIYECVPCAQAQRCSDLDLPGNGYPTEFDPDDQNSWTTPKNAAYDTYKWNKCNTSTCKWETATEYRCTSGYYGTAKPNYIEGFGIMGVNGCTQCPQHSTMTTVLNGQSNPTDNAAITKCWIDGDNYKSDFSGIFTFMSPDNRCYYSE